MASRRRLVEPLASEQAPLLHLHAALPSLSHAMLDGVAGRWRPVETISVGGLSREPSAKRGRGRARTCLGKGAMTESRPAASTGSTFVVRFRWEWSAAGTRWRGQIEHVQSGKKATFLDLGTMLEFICRFVAVLDDGCRSAENDGVKDGSGAKEFL
jgi:hypothetical protein